MLLSLGTEVPFLGEGGHYPVRLTSYNGKCDTDAGAEVWMVGRYEAKVKEEGRRGFCGAANYSKPLAAGKFKLSYKSGQMAGFLKK